MLRFVVAVLALVSSNAHASPTPNVKLREWDMGIAVESLRQADMTVYLWFYEWNMFDARQKGGHTRGTHLLKRSLSPDGSSALIVAPDMKLSVRAVKDGAELQLEITNQTQHDWPAIAGIIPCFNPGAPRGQTKRFPLARLNPQFTNERTWYVGRKGLRKLEKRAIHFNSSLRELVDRAATDGRHPFSHKWPTSADNAHAGLLVRESTDGKWVTGIAWERFLSSQGHNYWQCMHLCANVGPLKPGQSRTIRGRIYLFEGRKDDCLRRFRRDRAKWMEHRPRSVPDDRGR